MAFGELIVVYSSKGEWYVKKYNAEYSSVWLRLC